MVAGLEIYIILVSEQDFGPLQGAQERQRRRAGRQPDLRLVGGFGTLDAGAAFFGALDCAADGPKEHLKGVAPQALWRTRGAIHVPPVN